MGEQALYDKARVSAHFNIHALLSRPALDPCPKVESSRQNRVCAEQARHAEANRQIARGTRVLVVDDSRAQLMVVSALLRRWGFEVEQATSGPEALELIARRAPDFILSDWMMPGMDGLELCRRFRSGSGEDYGYFILLTSKSEKGAIVAGLDAGADDFLSKPINADELRARMNAGARILAMQRELSDKNRVISDALAELQTLYNGIEQDLKQARSIQQSLVPERSRDFGGASVSLLLKPCGHVGGDLVGMFSPGDSRIGFYNIDVSGHGITSALVTARVAGYLSSAFPEQNLAIETRFDRFLALRDPARVADLLNQRLASDPGVSEYLTMVFATFDWVTGHLKLVQAGHPPPLLMRADGTQTFLGDGGLPIGLIPEARYEQHDIWLQPGDRLLLYSDGFTESVLPDGTMLEQEGLQSLVGSVLAAREGTDFLDDLYWTLCATRAAQADSEDDVSAALLQVHPEK